MQDASDGGVRDDDRELGWGILGTGAIVEQRMLPAIVAEPGHRVAAVLSRSAERARAFAYRHGVPSAYDRLAQLLEDPAVDVVYVATRNELHAHQAIAAARAGRPVLCEKPLSLSLDDALAMQRACDAAGVALATNHPLRQAATLRAMRDMVRAGAIGQPRAARVAFTFDLPPKARTWRVTDVTGGGVALDVSVHSVDTLRFLLDREVRRVMAMSGARDEGRGPEEDLMAILELDGGVMASLHDSFNLGHAGTSVEVHGSEGTVVGTGVLGPHPTGTVELRRDGQVTEIDVGAREDIYRRTVRAFGHAVGGSARGSDELGQATGEDGMRSLAAGLAVLEAARSGRAVVLPSSAVPAGAPLGAPVGERELAAGIGAGRRRSNH